MTERDSIAPVRKIGQADPVEIIIRESEKLLEAQLKEREKPGERLYCKRLELVTPEHAKELGIATDLPVFVSSTDSTDSKPLVYQVGETLRVSLFRKKGNGFLVTKHHKTPRVALLHSRPRYGIGYFDKPAFVATTESEFWCDMKLTGWIAILEPAGRIVKHEDYFDAFDAIAEEVRVKDILAFCQVHPVFKEHKIHRGAPLKEGIVFSIGNPYLRIACSYEAHNKAIHDDHLPWFRFYYDRDGKITFDYSNQK